MITGDSAAIPPARTGVSADAALILEALGRLESAVQDERAVLDRLRVSLREMAHSIAMAKALADSETAATLLDEFEHRVDAMIEVAGGAPPEAIAPATEPEPPAESAAAEPAPVMAAYVEPPAAEPPPAAEHDQVPTVSGVVSRLGPDPDPFNEAVVQALHATEGADEHASSVAMLKAMVEALNAAVPTATPEPEAASEIAQPAVPAEETLASAIAAIPAEAEPAAMQAAEQPQPVEVAHVAEPPATTEIELSAVPLPSVDMIAALESPATSEPEPATAAAEIAPLESAPAEVLQLEEAQLTEPPIATEIGLTSAPLPSVDIVAATQPPPASDLEPVAPVEDIPALDWHIATESAESLAETEPAIAAAEIAPIETAPAEVLQLEEAQIAEPPQAIAADLPAEPVSVPSMAGLHETALLASIERMGTRPFPPPDEGTAVIFTLRPEPPAPPDIAALPPEPAPQALPEPAITQTALESMLAAPPTPAFGIGAETGPTDAELEAAMADPDFDPTDFLFGPEPEPAAEEMRGRQPEQAKQEEPEPEAPHDPLRALKAMSENEKIALFS